VYLIAVILIGVILLSLSSTGWLLSSEAQVISGHNSFRRALWNIMEKDRSLFYRTFWDMGHGTRESRTFHNKKA